MIKKILSIIIIFLSISCTTLVSTGIDIGVNYNPIPKSKLLRFSQIVQEAIDTVDAKWGYELEKYSYKGVEFFNYRKVKSKNALVYIHGGGFFTNYVNSARFNIVEDLMENSKVGFETILVDFKGTHYPEQSRESEVILKYIMSKYDKVVVMGDSSGGNVTLSMLLKMRDEGYKMPDGLVLLSPYSDLTNTVPSRKENFDKDVLFGKRDLNILNNNPYVKNIKDKKHPYVSPVFAKYHNFPKTLLQCSDIEMLRDDTIFVYNQMKKDLVDAKLEIYENEIHCFQLMSVFTHTKEARNNISKFLEGIYYDKRVEGK